MGLPVGFDATTGLRDGTGVGLSVTRFGVGAGVGCLSGLGGGACVGSEVIGFGA